MLHLFNSLTGQKEPFYPLSPQQITLYVCGPTVYDRIHLGNARSLVVFDTLFRLLQILYPSVIYVRNITDVDDKINEAARQRHISISELTSQTISFFHQDSQALHVKSPTHEPRATDYIQDMIQMICLLLDKGFAYETHSHVLFDVKAFPAYGHLSKMPLDQMKQGARVEVAPYKRSPLDFVLWKPSSDNCPGWSSPWGRGRPGWHIECSAMSQHYLGETFDIHGGGSDLLFPHHENERAQSCSLSGTCESARYWIHNGMLLVEGQKMSKSSGNFITVQDALLKYPGEVIRWALLSSHYRHPLDWTPSLLHQASCAVNRVYQSLYKAQQAGYHQAFQGDQPEEIQSEIFASLQDDLNTPQAFMHLQELVSQLNKEPCNHAVARQVESSARLMGFVQSPWEEWARPSSRLSLSKDEIEALLAKRRQARSLRDYTQADAIRAQLQSQGVLLEDIDSETTLWRYQFREFSCPSSD